MKRLFSFCLMICTSLHSQVPSLLKDIRPGLDSTQFGKYFVMSNNNVLFDVIGSGLWVTDGSSNGTELLKHRSSGNLTGKFFTEYAGKTYFSSPTTGYNLWRTDGTRNGTDSIPTNDVINITSIVPVNNLLLFFSYGVNGTNLWRSDGSIAGTYTIAFFNAGEEVYEVINNILYFKEYTNNEGFELWRTDGTSQGTFLLKDIRIGALSSLGNTGNNPILSSYNNSVFFTANDGINGLELWKTDGSQAGTILLRDINSGIASSSLNRNYFWKANNGAYFMANNLVNGRELWFSDGTINGTQLLLDAATGTASAEPQKLTFINNHAYYYYLDYNNLNSQTLNTQHLLFKTDGTPSGTSTLAISPAFNPTTYVFSTDDGFHVFNNELYFSMHRSDYIPAPSKDTILLCKIDSNFTSYNVVSKININSNLAGGSIDPYPKYISLQNNKLLYVYTGGNNNGFALAIFNLSNGTGKIQYQLGSLSSYSSSTFQFYNMGNKVYFPFPTNGDMEPSYIDLTSDTVKLLKDINPTGSSYNCTNSANAFWNHKLYKLNNKFYFLAFEPGYGLEFFETDFTPSGTFRVLDINPGSKSFDKNNYQNTCNGKFIIETPNNIYFGADNGLNGFELWSFINSPNNPVGMIEQAVNENQINLYPNPASYQIQIQASLGFNAADKIQLIDVLGKEVKILNGINANEMTIDLNGLNSGLYFIKIEGPEKKSSTHKMIVTQ